MKYLLLTALVFTPATASATLINGVDLGSGGNIKMVSSIYFNVSEADIGNISQGVGDVQQILDSTGSVLWQNGDNNTSLWFVFDNLETEAIVPVFGQSFTFFNTGGTVDFYTLGSGFGLTSGGDFGVESSLISSGDLFLSGVGDAVNGWTSTALSDTIFNIGSGQFELAITSGAAASRIATQSIIRTDGSYTDFTFNYSSDSLNSAGWDYVGSADVSTVTTAIPNVSTASLMGLGLLGMAGLYRRKDLSATSNGLTLGS